MRRYRSLASYLLLPLIALLTLTTGQQGFAQTTVNDAWQNNIPGPAATLKEEAKALIERHDYQGAIMKLEQSLAFKQDYYLAVYNLALAYALRGTDAQAPSESDRKRAWRELSKAQTIAEAQGVRDAALYTTMGWLASMEAIFSQPEEFSRRTEWYDAAQRYWESALKIDAASAGTLNNLGVLYELRGDSKRASEYYAKAVDVTTAADNLEKQRQALNIISDFASRICVTVPLSGTSGNVELSGKGKAELNELLRKIANLGIEGAAQYQASQYEGVLQKELAEQLNKSRDCQRAVSQDLINRLLPPLSQVPPRKEPGSDEPTGAGFSPVEFESSCGFSIQSVKGSFSFPSAPCFYGTANRPPEEYELTFEARSVDGHGYGVWFRGQWDNGSPRAVGVQYEVTLGVFYFFHYPALANIVAISRSLDRKWHRWKIVGDSYSATFYLDDERLMKINQPPEGPYFGFRTWTGQLQVRNIVASRVSR